MPTPLRDLRALLALLRREDDLVEIDAEVDSALEIAEIHRRVIAASGPALLFKRVRGSAYPVVTNLFGSARRVELAFGARPMEFVRSLCELPRTLMPPTLRGLWSARALLARGLRVGTRRVKRGPVCERVDEPARLGDLPLLKLWPEDGGHFVTLPLVLTRHPSRPEHNLGMYRMQRYDEVTTGMHWQIAKGGGFHYHEAERLGVPLPVTVSLGGPPALILAAIAPLPEGVPEILLASMALGERLRVIEREGALPLFADAEFVLEGEVRPAERRAEGPFGDHYGYYSLRHDFPVFRCARVHHRADAIYPATVVGKPRQEDFFIGEYLQTLLAPLVSLVMPSVVDLWSYGETGFHALSAAVVRDRYAREALASAFRILGEGQLSLTKFLLLTDAPQDLRDFPALLSHVLARADFATDLYVFSNLAMDTLDYTGPEINRGSKGVLLGLGPARRALPRDYRGEPPTGCVDARPFCPGALVVQGEPYVCARELPGRIAADSRVRDWPLVVLVDDARAACASVPSFLWTAFTRFEPAADLHAREARVASHHLAYAPPLVLDARMKPWYPPVVAADEATERRVSSRWHEYFPTRRVEMGDARAANVG